MKSYIKHYAIVGRIPDEENITWRGAEVSRTEAIRCFVRQLYADHDRTPQQVMKQHGAAFYLDALLVSETDIEVFPVNHIANYFDPAGQLKE